MTEKPAKPPGQGVKIVRRQLADGTIKEYVYGRKDRKPRAPTGALRQIFNAYSVSPEFKRSVPEWQARKLWLFNLIEKHLGWMTREDLEDRSARTEFYALRDSYADLPHRADKMMQSLAAALQWAYDRAMIGVNHAARIPAFNNPRLSPHRDVYFTLEQEDAILSAAPDDLRHLYLLGLYTGLRRSDLIALRWSALKDGWLSVLPSKTSRTTGIRLALPVRALPPLAGLLEEIPRRGETILTTDTGRAWSQYNASQRWRRLMIQLELRPHRLNTIRHTTGTRLAQAGCTEAEQAAILGHAAASGIGSVYTARTRELALHAYQKWHRWMQGGAEVVAFSRVLENDPRSRG